MAKKLVKGLSKIFSKSGRSGAEATIRAGLEHIKSLDFDKAIAKLEVAIRSDPRNPMAHDYMEVAYRGKSLKLEDESWPAFQREPAEEADLAKSEGIALMNGDYDKAIECFKRAIALEPTDAGAHALLAETYSRKAAYLRSLPK